MKTKSQIKCNINQLISFIQQNEQSLLRSSLPKYNREILDIKNNFYTIANDLSSEFTEQELYTIENDLSFYYQTLKEIIDFINNRIQMNSPLFVIDPPQQHLAIRTIYPPVPSIINSCLINQEDINQYAIYIQRRVDGIQKELEKKQKLQKAEMYQSYKKWSDKLDQKMMALDEELFNRQTRRHKALMKEIENVFDGD